MPNLLGELAGICDFKLVQIVLQIQRGWRRQTIDPSVMAAQLPASQVTFHNTIRTTVLPVQVSSITAQQSCQYRSVSLQYNSPANTGQYMFMGWCGARGLFNLVKTADLGLHTGD